MLHKLAELEESAARAIEGAKNSKELGELRVRYLGKKGALTALLRRMGELPPEQRPRAGKRANALRSKLERLLEQGEERLREAAAASRVEEERIDVTLPGAPFNPGQKHPLTWFSKRSPPSSPVSVSGGPGRGSSDYYIQL